MSRPLTATDIIATRSQMAEIRRCSDRITRFLSQVSPPLLVTGERITISPTQTAFLESQIRTIESTLYAIRLRFPKPIVLTDK